MSAAKSIKRIFNRVASHGATAFMALALSVGTGIGTFNGLDSTHSPTAPVTNTQAFSVAESTVKNLTRDILREQTRLDFTANSIAKAQGNLGTNSGSLTTQMQELEAAREQYGRDMEAQMKRLADFRREIWFNPALSEKQAHTLYTDLFYAAQGQNLGTINNYLAPLTDALTFRDETIAAMNLPADPLKVDAATVGHVVDQARATDSSHDTLEVLGGIGAALAEGLLAAGLIAAGFRGRKREEEEAKAEKEQQVRAKRNEEHAARERQRAAEQALTAAVPDNKPLAVPESAAAKKPAGGPGKFSV